MIRRSLAAVLLASAAAAQSKHPFADRYQATLDFSEPPQGRAWQCDAHDVFTLKSFRIDQPQLKLRLDACQIVLGHHERNVLWAAVLPDAPGKLEAAPQGQGEAVTGIWLRFHPARLQELIPKETIVGQGKADAVALGKRMCAWKIGGSWQSGNLPVVPWRHWLIVDVDTDAPARRFFSVDGKTDTVKPEPAFTNRPLPALRAVTKDQALAAFDTVWSAFDREYAMFGIKAGVNWQTLRDTWRPRAQTATNSYAVAVALAGLVEPLQDLHVWVKAGDEFVPIAARNRPLNGNWRACLARWQKAVDSKVGVVHARNDDGVGYVAIHQLGKKELVAAFDQALDALADCHALIIDLRFNGGGDETLARQIAGRFLAETSLYSSSRFRNGKRHDDLGPPQPRRCEPRGPWRYQSPVVVLQGQRTMSSAESFALMLAQAPNVTTMGDRTAGSSGNPRQVQTDIGVVVNLPRWLDLDPKGKPIEDVGIPPQVRVDANEQDFTPTHDPVLEAALAHLDKLPAAERKPGKR